MKDKYEHKIILFDGVCNLCNAAVIFIIRRDKRDTFRFAALQSEVGETYIEKHQIDTSRTDSIILIDGDKHYEKSSAALKTARYLSGGYPVLYAFMLVPKPVRNWVYDYIAKHRYKWFGKKDSCMIPTPELQNKFL